MNKQEFQQLFEKAIALAFSYGEQALQKGLPRRASFKLHGAGYSGEMANFDQVLDALYLGNEKFFRVIDISVLDVKQDETLLFVGVSGHAPSSFDKTRNAHSGMGPFNPVIPLQNKDLEKFIEWEE